VAFCRSRAELEAAWSAIHGRANAMGGSNNTLVVQQQVHGTQYIVNTVSAAGQHMIAEIWADHRVRTADGHGVYDRTAWLSPGEDPALYTQLASYVRRAITAVGIQHGPAHSEVMLTETGPILIETGARPEGPVNPDAVTRAIGTHHVRAAVDAVIAGRVVPDREPRTLRHACRVTLCAPYDGTIDSAAWAEVLDLPCVAGTLGHVTGGSPVRTTVDLLTSPDSVYLVGEPDVIERSYRAIRALERDGSLYRPVVDS
jgi:biotin carboxylase